MLGNALGFPLNTCKSSHSLFQDLNCSWKRNKDADNKIQALAFNVRSPDNRIRACLVQCASCCFLDVYNACCFQKQKCFPPPCLLKDSAVDFDFLLGGSSHPMEGLNSLAGRAYYCEFWGNISWGELWILTTMSKPKEWDKMTVGAWWEHPLPWMSGGCCGKKNGSFLLKCTGASLS